jgi:methylmalonyl-CoA/ethylmalonyl-CoA epimerase
VKVVFLKKDGSLTVKLIEPTDATSPIFMHAQKGGGLHHLCFKCDDLARQLELMQQQGLRVIASPQPGEAFENEEIAFVYANHGLSIELIDTDKRACRIP